MPWTYHQKSGAWHDPHGTLMHYGYSGHGAGVSSIIHRAAIPSPR